MFHNMVQDWFAAFSYFDTGEWVSEKSESERFYYRFGLGIMVELLNLYILTSDRENGLGK